VEGAEGVLRFSRKTQVNISHCGGEFKLSR